MCALLAIRVYTQLLSPTEFGKVMMAMGGIAFVDGLLTMAFDQTILSLCGQIHDRKRQRTIAAGLALRLVWVQAVIFCLSLLISVLLAIFFKWGLIVAFLLILSFVYISSETLKTSMLSPLAANRRYSRFSLWTTVEGVSVLTITTCGLIFLRPNLLVFVSCLVTGKIISTSALFVLQFKSKYFRDIDRVDVSHVQADAWQHGWPISLMSPLGWTATYLDRFILAAVGGLAITGTYSAAVGLVGRPYGLTSSVLTNYFRPRFYTSTTGEVDSGLRRTALIQWITCAFVIGSLGTIAFATIGKTIGAVLLARSYRADLTFFLVFLSFGQTLSIMTHALDNFILALGESSTLLKTQFGLAFITTSVLPVSMIAFGARGAPVGRCLAELTKFGCTLLLACYFMKKRLVPNYYSSASSGIDRRLIDPQEP